MSPAYALVTQKKTSHKIPFFKHFFLSLKLLILCKWHSTKILIKTQHFNLKTTFLKCLKNVFNSYCVTRVVNVKHELVVAGVLSPLKESDFPSFSQVLPVFVLEVLNYPGLPGIFVSSLFCASLRYKSHFFMLETFSNILIFILKKCAKLHHIY